MRAWDWPELITPSSATLLGVEQPGQGSIVPGVIDRNAIFSMEAMTAAVIIYINANGPSMEAMTTAAILNSPGLGPSMDSTTVAVILQTT